MWCKKCNRFTYDEVCDICGEKTQEDIPTEIHWCPICKIPIVQSLNNILDSCPICGGKISYIAKDIRPVFPEERLLIELLIDEPLKWINDSVWANNNRYYINGKVFVLNSEFFKKTIINKVIENLSIYKDKNEQEHFNKYIQKFCLANRDRLNWIKNEAYSFIKKEASQYSSEQIVVSFSGGKDSTVVSDLVVRALLNPSIVHIFGDTTLEFPLTYEYLTRFRKNNPKYIIKIAKNKDQDFYKVCEDIGPPARMMRWCCTMFKTGPITRVLNSLFDKENILTFYGIRKCESVSRSKYDRVAEGADVKIQKQKVASPIFFWSNLEIWLYILSDGIDFNQAYRLGYDRVGCWCCPNNNERAQFLAQIYMSEQHNKWRNYLISFAKLIGKPDPEEYVDGGWWKARQGGNGVASAEDVKLKFTNCTAEDHAKIYNLNKPITDSFYELFIPFGKISKELGRKILNEVIVLDLASKVPILSIQLFRQEGYDYSIKVKTLNVKSHDDLQRMVGYQIRKYNACRKCMKCESICQYNAISVSKEGYHIDELKCKHCKKCVSSKYLDGGCLMDKYLKVRKDNIR